MWLAQMWLGLSHVDHQAVPVQIKFDSDEIWFRDLVETVRVRALLDSHLHTIVIHLFTHVNPNINSNNNYKLKQLSYINPKGSKKTRLPQEVRDYSSRINDKSPAFFLTFNN